MESEKVLVAVIKEIGQMCVVQQLRAVLEGGRGEGRGCSGDFYPPGGVV